eukprot:647644-Karenia_brevis.AAC.1
MYFVEPVLRRWQDHDIGACIAGEYVPILGYADDMTIMATDFQQLIQMVRDLITSFDKMGLCLSQAKTM